MARNISFVVLAGALLVGGCAALAWLQAWPHIRPFALVLLSASHAAWLWLERRRFRWAAAGALLGPAALCAHWTSRHGAGAWARGFAYLGVLSATLLAAQAAVEKLWVWPAPT